MHFTLRPAPFILGLVLLLAGVAPVLALNESSQVQFDKILKMEMPELTRTAGDLLEKKYPAEDWERYGFPTFVFTSDGVEVGYMIAVKEPALLGGSEIIGQAGSIPCYCFCDAMGHKSLLHCFVKGGQLSNGFDDHAAGCNICYGQAILVFLWNDLGATHQEILQGQEKRFSRLLKMREGRKI